MFAGDVMYDFQYKVFLADRVILTVALMALCCVRPSVCRL